VVLHPNASHGPSSPYRLLRWPHDAHRQDRIQTLVREIREELDVAIAPASASPVGTFEAQAHGRTTGITVRMTCYAADYQGTLTASSEIAEFVWLSYADRERVSPVDQIIFDHLHGDGQLA